MNAPPIIAAPKPLDWAILGALIIIWGSAYAATHVALNGFPPAILVSVRLWVGTLVLGLGALAFGARLPPLGDWRSWGAMLAIGSVGTLLPFLLISHAQQHVPSALAAVYIAGAPLTVAVLSHFIVPGERLSLRRALGVLVGFAGIVILFLPALLQGGTGAASLLDQALLVVAATCYGAAGILVRLSGPKVHPVAMSLGFVLCSAVLSLPVAASELPVTLTPAGPEIAAAMALGLFATGVASLLYVLVIRRVGPVFMSNVGNLAPFWSILVGGVFLGEALPVSLFLALGVILIGVFLVQRRDPAPAPSSGGPSRTG